MTSPTEHDPLSDDEIAAAERLLSVTAEPIAAQVVVVSVGGEVDMVTAPLLDLRLGEQLTTDAGSLVLDLTGVTFLGSQGLAALVEAQRRADETDTRLLIVAPHRAERRPLTATGLDEVLALFDDMPAALSAARTR